MNMVWIAGHLGADPEVRFTSTGQKIVNLRVATNSRRQGKDETVWWRVTIFGDRFDKMLTYLKKGSAVIIMGKMNPPQIWADKEGKQNITLEIVAETIDFSPFGKSERSQESGSAGSSNSMSNRDFQNPMQSPSYDSSRGKQPSYNREVEAYAQESSRGMPSDDDDLPF